MMLMEHDAEGAEDGAQQQQRCTHVVQGSARLYSYLAAGPQCTSLPAERITPAVARSVSAVQSRDALLAGVAGGLAPIMITPASSGKAPLSASIAERRWPSVQPFELSALLPRMMPKQCRR